MAARVCVCWDTEGPGSELAEAGRQLDARPRSNEVAAAGTAWQEGSLSPQERVREGGGNRATAPSAEEARQSIQGGARC